MPLGTHALCRLHEVRHELGITDLTKDKVLERLINAVSAAVATLANRSFERNAAVVSDVPGHGTPFLLVPQAPIVSITSITRLDTQGSVIETLDSTTYRVESASAGIIFRDGGFLNTAMMGSGVMNNPVPHSHTNAWRVTYVGGYITPWQASAGYPGGSVGTRDLPYELEQAAIEAAVTLYRKKGRDDQVKEEKLGPTTVKYFSDAERNKAKLLLTDEAIEVAMQHRWEPT